MYFRLENDVRKTLVNARDRDGLWQVNKKMKDANYATLLICKDLVDKMMKNHM